MPNHWQKTTLGEIADLEIGKTPPRNASQYWTESLGRPFCSIADMQGRVIKPSREGVTELAEGENKARRISAGSLLMSFKLTIGRMAFAGCDLFPNEAIVAITPNEVSASREFLYLNLGSRDLTEGSGQAVKGKTLNSKSLRAIQIHLPPIEEQRRIVDLVGSIDTYIDSLDTQIETTRTARSALLSELLSNPGDDWQETTLNGLIAVTIGGVWGADPGEDEVDVPVYRQTEFDDAGRLHQPAGAIRSITYRQLASRTLEENDVLMQKSAGTPTLPGRVVLVPKLFEASSFSNFLNLIRADRRSVEPVFLFLLLQHLHATKVAFEFQRGTNIRNLDLKSYLAITLLVPSLEEQRRIVDLVGSFDEQILSLESQVESVRALRSGVLSELLSGERLLDESYDVAVGL